jgi:hypothetical protein
MATAKTLDLLRKRRAEFLAGEVPRFVAPAPARVLAIAGKGEPGGPAFRAAVSALVAVAGIVRMGRKKGGHDFKVSHLEALWWPPRRQGTAFAWKVFLRVPAFVTTREVKSAAAHAVGRGKTAAARIALEAFEEGECVQGLHVGPTEEVGATIERLDQAARAQGRALAPPVHQIYLNGPPTPPERLRTIVRHPLAAPRKGAKASAGRDRTPVSIRQRRGGAEPQHRGREMR